MWCHILFVDIFSSNAIYTFFVYALEVCIAICNTPPPPLPEKKWAFSEFGGVYRVFPGFLYFYNWFHMVLDIFSGGEGGSVTFSWFLKKKHTFSLGHIENYLYWMIKKININPIELHKKFKKSFEICNFFKDIIELKKEKNFEK